MIHQTAPRSNRELNYDLAFLYIITCSHNNYKDWRFPTNQEYSSPLIPVNTWYESNELERFYDRLNFTRHAMPVR